MNAELIVLPDPETVKRRLFELWAWKSGRDTPRALRLLEMEYEGIEIAMPAASTMRSWISKERWAERANRELARDYPQQVEQMRQELYTAVRLFNGRVLDAMLGIRPLDRDTTMAGRALWQMWGIGTFGANQGGEMSLTFDGGGEEAQVLSLEQRARAMRAMMAEKNERRA